MRVYRLPAAAIKTKPFGILLTNVYRLSTPCTLSYLSTLLGMYTRFSNIQHFDSNLLFNKRFLFLKQLVTMFKRTEFVVLMFCNNCLANSPTSSSSSVHYTDDNVCKLLPQFRKIQEYDNLEDCHTLVLQQPQTTSQCIRAINSASFFSSLFSGHQP